MNNFKYIILHDLKEAAHMLCDMSERESGCDKCPVRKRCEGGINGWIDYFREEHE